MSRNRRRGRGKVLAFSILILTFLILILLLLIGFLLLRRSSVNPLKQTDVLTEEYTDASGNTSGQRAYIQISKNILKSVSEKQFRSFCEDVISDGDYVYFTIQCDDGTGIVFTEAPSSSEEGSTLAHYGYINSAGSITETFGRIVLKNGICKYHAL